MALPEIPDSWFKLIQIIVASVITLLAVLGYQKADRVEVKQAENHQTLGQVQAKQIENSAKIDAGVAKTEEIHRSIAAVGTKVGAKMPEPTVPTNR